ncbi:MAG: hypothetical protein FWG10_05350 [Eubacteriaceae bacterium]|nr:hypothetical protein [Eubacteriaceae bacterium]
MDRIVIKKSFTRRLKDCFLYGLMFAVIATTLGVNRGEDLHIFIRSVLGIGSVIFSLIFLNSIFRLAIAKELLVLDSEGFILVDIGRAKWEDVVGVALGQTGKILVELDNIDVFLGRLPKKVSYRLASSTSYGLSVFLQSSYVEGKGISYSDFLQVHRDDENIQYYVILSIALDNPNEDVFDIASIMGELLDIFKSSHSIPRSGAKKKSEPIFWRREGELFRRQHFYMFIFSGFIANAALFFYSCVNAFFTGSLAQYFSISNLAIRFVAFLASTVPFIALELLAGKFFASKVCLLNQEGAYTREGFIAWRDINQIAFSFGFLPTQKSQPAGMEIANSRGNKTMFVKHAPYSLLKAIKSNKETAQVSLRL